MSDADTARNEPCPACGGSGHERTAPDEAGPGALSCDECGGTGIRSDLRCSITRAVGALYDEAEFRREVLGSDADNARADELQLVAELAEDALNEHGAFIDIVFDGPPAPEAGRFVEVEDAEGRSIDLGGWMERNDGTWALRIPVDGSRR